MAIEGEQTKEEREKIYQQSLHEAENGGAEPTEKAEKVVASGFAEQGSLGKVKTEVEKKGELHKENQQMFSNVGYRKIDNDNLPSKGRFNDPTLRIRIRAATVEEIKHYSGLDETDLKDVSDHINEVLKACCKIEYSTKVGNADDLKEADKYYVLFCIRDLSMEVHQRFNKLSQTCQCPKCGKKSSNEITSHAFSSYSIPKSIDKHYDASLRKIVVKDETFGGEPLIVSPPSVGLSIAIQNYMQEYARKQQQSGAPVYFDAKFMLKLQYLLDSPEQVNEIYLEQLKKRVDAWTYDKTMAFEYLRDNMDVGVRPQLEVICRDSEAINDVNQEVWCKDDYSFTAPVIFRQGWRSVFDLSGVITRLFDSDTE